MITTEQIILIGVTGIITLIIFLFLILSYSKSGLTRMRKYEKKSAEKFEERIKEKLDENLRKLVYLPWKSWLTIFVIGVIITLVCNLHGLNEVWAWEVAKALITINGLVLAFGTLGAAFFSSREAIQPRYEAMTKESVEEIMKRIVESKEKSEAALEEFLEKEMYILMLKPAIQLSLVGHVFKVSLTCILVSTGSALCLFGVSDALATTFPFEILFLLMFSNAIIFFLLGVHYLIEGTFTFLEMGTSYSFEETLKLSVEAFEKRFRELEKQKEKSG